jgi:hypothetical protein
MPDKKTKIPPIVDEKADYNNSESDRIKEREADSNTININMFKSFKGIYDFNDVDHILNLGYSGSHVSRLYSLDKLLKRDNQREKDGFPRKIKLGKLVKPSRDGGDKSIIVPTASEEKFLHWEGEITDGEGSPTGGSGEEGEGEIIGEVPLRPEDGEGEGAGQGKGSKHGMGAEAYEIGKILTDQFELPNIKEKGKKTSLTKYTYELSDKNRGHGQILDKKATLKQVVKTNLALGKISIDDEVDSTKL